MTSMRREIARLGLYDVGQKIVTRPNKTKASAYGKRLKSQGRIIKVSIKQQTQVAFVDWEWSLEMVKDDRVQWWRVLCVTITFERLYSTARVECLRPVTPFMIFNDRSMVGDRAPVTLMTHFVIWVWKLGKWHPPILTPPKISNTRVSERLVTLTVIEADGVRPDIDMRVATNWTSSL